MLATTPGAATPAAPEAAREFSLDEAMDSDAFRRILRKKGIDDPHSADQEQLKKYYELSERSTDALDRYKTSIKADLLARVDGTMTDQQSKDLEAYFDAQTIEQAEGRTPVDGTLEHHIESIKDFQERQKAIKDNEAEFKRLGGPTGIVQEIAKLEVKLDELPTDFIERNIMRAGLWASKSWKEMRAGMAQAAKDLVEIPKQIAAYKNLLELHKKYEETRGMLFENFEPATVIQKEVLAARHEVMQEFSKRDFFENMQAENEAKAKKKQRSADQLEGDYKASMKEGLKTYATLRKAKAEGIDVGDLDAYMIGFRENLADAFSKDLVDKIKQKPDNSNTLRKDIRELVENSVKEMGEADVTRAAVKDILGFVINNLIGERAKLDDPGDKNLGKIQVVNLILRSI